LGALKPLLQMVIIVVFHKFQAIFFHKILRILVISETPAIPVLPFLDDHNAT
jgi:hypothetical protein